MPHIDTEGQGVVGGGGPRTGNWGPNSHGNKSEVPAVTVRSLEGIGCRGYSPQTVPVRLLTRSVLEEPWELLLFFWCVSLSYAGCSVCMTLLTVGCCIV